MIVSAGPSAAVPLAFGHRWFRAGTRVALAACLATVAAVPVAAQDGVRVIARTLLGTLAVEVRASPIVGVRVGVADSSGVVLVQVRGTDARRWADSASRMLARRPGATGSWRAVLEEPGMGSGALILTRLDSARVVRLALFASDNPPGGSRTGLTASEARTLVSIVRRAAAQAAPPRARPRRKPSSPSLGGHATQLLAGLRGLGVPGVELESGVDLRDGPPEVAATRHRPRQVEVRQGQ
jgi:hypothetical protein